MPYINSRLSEQFFTRTDKHPDLRSFGVLLLKVVEQGFLSSFVNRNLYLNDYVDIRFVDGQHPLNLSKRLITSFGNIYIPKHDWDGTLQDAYKVTEWFFDDTKEDGLDKILWIRYEGDSVPKQNTGENNEAKI